ncbi:hypothetical protein CHS0354_002292 [Potamilus streckersoni]|uniref:LRAT domain-containing protein n=1 Tax=Potamilus streckersoni TaxID=2493646 RepID=A0AAE0SNJ5_9BIVA|nr:hypothetical protein CHS0354_002292 [Potamilus streckersoni]
MVMRSISRNNNERISFEESDNDDAERDYRELPSIQNPENSEEIVVEDFIQNLEALNDGSDRSCADCSKARRVEDMRSLQKGQHIAMPGEHSSHYFKFLRKRISAYRHHGIVERIVQASRQTAEVTLIHFYKEDNVIKVRKQTKTYNLTYDELYIIEYQYPRYNPDTIIQRAESVLEQSENGDLFESYNLLTQNCEHFATWCVLGKKVSLQVHTRFNNIMQMLRNSFAGAQLFLKKLVHFFRKIPSVLTKVAAPPVLLGLSSVAYIIYCIFKTVYLIKQYRNDKTICWHCLKEKILDLWLQCGAFAVTSVISYVIITFALPLIGLIVTGIGIEIGLLLIFLASIAGQSITLPLQIPLTIGVVLGGALLNWVVPRIRKALWSPVQHSEKTITSLSALNVGDVVSLTYYGLTHLVVVSEVTWNNNTEQGTVRGIHYSLHGLLDTIEIAEEDFPVDLGSSKLNLVEFNTLFTYSPEEVVNRARKRIGERKWKMSSNRSEHLCRWAKVRLDHNSEDIGQLDDEDTGNIHSTNLSSLMVGKSDVHLMNEIQLGDVVEYGSYKGIVIQLEDVTDGRVFFMHTVIRKSCFQYYGEKVKLRIDLNKDYLNVHRYHPVHCVSRSERVRKAIGMIGEKIQRWTQTGFVEDIILKQR